MLKRIFGRGKDVAARAKKTAVAMMTMATAALATAIPAMAGEPSPEPVDFGAGSFDFSMADVVSTAWNFLNIFPEWVKLVLGVLFSATIIGFLLWIFSQIPKFRRKASS